LRLKKLKEINHQQNRPFKVQHYTPIQNLLRFQNIVNETTSTI